MKASNFFEMTNEELNLKLNSLKEELFNLRFKHKAGQLENANQLAICKKDIARVKTIIRQRELGISQEPNKAVKKSAKKAK
ncbi:MAG: 50S ribosomal protein L29 [Clostridia bacterium]|nr:50S ribosomal protein L29 [Clostridia bacterium]MDE6361396.1 50S ribosomal protein L29 [Clostridia bacterium]MDE6372002.1 50S ribosomal protein L29 [Clostridia bacterium]MDE6473946.1 50S ribosomal protein L29 [Clostridia bacterium]MDE6605296.1 50S ribosomal protein L29 [Clostridia bacterium]